jgi:hypothetical protein
VQGFDGLVPGELGVVDEDRFDGVEGVADLFVAEPAQDAVLDDQVQPGLTRGPYSSISRQTCRSLWSLSRMTMVRRPWTNCTHLADRFKVGGPHPERPDAVLLDQWRFQVDADHLRAELAQLIR